MLSTFAQKLRDRLQVLGEERREITPLRKAAPKLQAKDVLEKLARKYNVPVKQLLDAKVRGLDARNVAMWMVWETGTQSLGQIGELFGGLDYAAVAQRIRRTRLAHNPAVTRKLLAEMSTV